MICFSPRPRPDPRLVTHGPPPTSSGSLTSRMCKALHMSAPALPGQLERKPDVWGVGEKLASTHEAARLVIYLPSSETLIRALESRRWPSLWLQSPPMFSRSPLSPPPSPSQADLPRSAVSPACAARKQAGLSREAVATLLWGQFRVAQP